jgi:hypothetical protein
MNIVDAVLRHMALQAFFRTAGGHDPHVRHQATEMR